MLFKQEWDGSANVGSSSETYFGLGEKKMQVSKSSSTK